ncbi:MAG TPA: hypothetical protein IAB79_05985 [Candidatus Faecousia excrementipullorum]|nr:hypothetical protein [Candidatus Faecousia excrementipullorum]
MKKKLALVLAVLLLLSACAPKDDPEPSTTGTQTPTTEAPTTEPPTEGEETAWYAQEAATPLSYEDLTTKDLPYSGAKWLIAQDGKAWVYHLYNNAGVLEVTDEGGWDGPAHTIALPEELAAATALGGDGRVGYLFTDTQIASVDLQTEEVKVLAEADRLLDVVMVSYDVIYFANEAEGKAAIYRLYIPDGKVDTIYEDIPVYPASEFRLIAPETTLGKIGWTMMNPEIMEILTKEFKNPDSVYQNTSQKFDFSGVWGQPGMIDTYQENNPLARSICQVIQEKTGTPALVRCWYDPQTEEYSQEFGVIDDCFTGTGLRHDHYDPDAAAPAAPKVSAGEWQALEAKTPVEAGEGASDCFLYAKPYEYPALFALIPGQDPVQLLEGVTEWASFQNHIYAITREGDLVQASSMGSQTLYKAQQGALRLLDCQNGMVYAMDGEYLVQVDLENMQQRTILKGEAVVHCSFIDENQLFVCQSKGLHEMQYILNPQTLTLEETVLN